ncbi:alpha/beta hydrolase [Mucilaginibacter limnophilus]|uniref:Alpha/beta hydrolase n=1 Tax=Mucilaginibacter limnophilus TaxID=1932778 RepID=A0A3S2V7T1_9SPHI|nr:alpha/beta hydrolase [Mucilaginibacter limnophilus]RVU00637.1 alpha/beta hydrolase [Mucilaginibacter limnophilus]
METLSSALNGQYAVVNGLNMYYEVHGSGKPLVLIHGGGSTIQTTFGLILPYLAESRKVIAVELQAHGHTPDRGTPTSFEQDADDVAELIRYFKIEKADILGFSNGGQTALQVAIRHPELVAKLIIASAFYKRDGLPAQFWEFMNNASIDYMPQGLKDAYLEITNSPERLQIMHDRDALRMQTFEDWSDNDIQGIKAPTLVISADRDVVKPEHAVQMFKLLPNAKLIILPGQHGEYLGELIFKKPGSNIHVVTAGLINDFLETNFAVE